MFPRYCRTPLHTQGNRGAKMAEGFPRATQPSPHLSHKLADSPAVSIGSSSSLLSTRMKSLPRPWYLEKGTSFVALISTTAVEAPHRRAAAAVGNLLRARAPPGATTKPEAWRAPSSTTANVADSMVVRYICCGSSAAAAGDTQERGRGSETVSNHPLLPERRSCLFRWREPKPRGPHLLSRFTHAEVSLLCGRRSREMTILSMKWHKLANPLEDRVAADFSGSRKGVLVVNGSASFCVVWAVCWRVGCFGTLAGSNMSSVAFVFSARLLTRELGHVCLDCKVHLHTMARLRWVPQASDGRTCCPDGASHKVTHTPDMLLPSLPVAVSQWQYLTRCTSLCHNNQQHGCFYEAKFDVELCVASCVAWNSLCRHLFAFLCPSRGSQRTLHSLLS